MRFVSILFVLALSTPGAALGQGVTHVTLQTLVDEALASNPEIAAARARLEAALERPAQARSLPDPTISAGWASVGNPLPGAGLGDEPMANIGVMVTQPIPYPGKRTLSATIAEREAQAERHRLDAIRRRVVARVKDAYFRLASIAAAERVLQREGDLLATLLKVSESRYGVGRTAQQDVFKAQAALTTLELQREELHHERRAREAELNALRDRPPDSPVGEPEPLALATLDESFDALLERARALAPALHRERAIIQAAETAVEAARREYRPDFALSGGYFNQGSMPATYQFRVDLVFPLQRARRAAAVREQSRRLSAARLELRNVERDLEERLQEAYHLASSSARLARLYRDALLPQLRLALEASLASYQTGAVDFLSVLTNATAVLENETRYYDRLAAFHIAVSRIEELTGEPPMLRGLP